MKMTDEQKAELAQTVAEELPWIDGVTARQAVDVMDDEGALRHRGREVLPDEIPNGAMGRVEYDVLTKNHMTGEFVITRHMEVTSRSGLNLTARPLIDQQVKNVRYFIMEEPNTIREQLVEVFKTAPASLTDKGLAEYLMARFDVTEKDAEKPKQTIRSHQRGSARELGESDEEYEKRTGPVYGPETWRGRSRD